MAEAIRTVLLQVCNLIMRVVPCHVRDHISTVIVVCFIECAITVIIHERLVVLWFFKFF